ncbi:putative Heterogeneous nuclear ribonucleoprotein H, partial [Operophtera brumata]
MNGSGDNSYIIKLRGLPFSTTVQEVVTFLSDVNILNGKDGVHLTEVRPGRPSGECFVEVESQEDNEDGFDDIPYLNDSMGIVKLRGLPFGCSKEEIVTFFDGITVSPDGVHLLTDSSGRASGEAFVHFNDKGSAQEALTRDREKIGHRYIEVFISSADEVRQYGDRMESRFGPARGGAGGGGYRPAPYDRNDRFGGRFNSRGGGGGGFGGGGYGGRDGGFGGGGRLRDGGCGGGFSIHMRGLPFKATPQDIAY